MWPKTYEGAELAQNSGQIWTQHAKKPHNNLLFDHTDGFEFFLNFWVQNLSYLLLLQEGTAAKFPALAPVFIKSSSVPIFFFMSELSLLSVLYGS